MGKRIAILQSNDIPRKGTFDLINSVDDFILNDTAQSTKNDWRNRNKIKTPRGVIWLTIPARHSFGRSIQETLFPSAGITLTYMNDPGYSEDRQLFPPFEHGVSITELIFNEGPDAPKYMKSFFGRSAEKPVVGGT
jgi:hypothetical protein